MSRRTFIVWTFFLILQGQVFGQLDVRVADKEAIEASSDGFFYTLPRTGLTVDIQVKKTQRIKGPYAEFAEKYLGLTQVITQNSLEYEILTIQIGSFSEPDPTTFYFVQNTGKIKDRQAIDMFLSEQGALISMSNVPEELERNRKKDEASVIGFRIPEVANPSLYERVDTLIRRISVDTTMIEQKVLKKISSAKTPEQKAKEAADFILKLDESMFNLINGYQEVSYEKGTMEFMYSQMDKLKSDYMQLFKGVTGVITENYHFTFIPQKGKQSQSTTLCRFSKYTGILEKNSAGGEPVQLNITGLDGLSRIRSMIHERNADTKVKKGLYYCIPDEAVVSLKTGNHVWIENQYTINQLGEVTYLPSTAMTNVEFYDNSGSIKHIILR